MKKLKVISMGRVGTVAINRFLDDHPQITLPSYKKTNEVFKNPRAGFEMMPFDLSPMLKVKGIVIHDGLYLKKKNKKLLNNIISPKVEKLIHLVRNPKEQVVSWINYINACSIAGLGNWKAIDYSIKTFYELYKHHFDTLLVGKQMDLFYTSLNKNEEVKLVDFDELSSKNINNTMSNLYQYLEVDDYDCRFLKEQQNNLTISLLSEGFKFQLNNEIIHLAFAPLDFFYDVNGPNETPWLILDKPQEFCQYCPSLPTLTDKLVVEPKDKHEFNKLSYKTRQIFHEDILNIIGQIMPLWAKNAENVAQKVAEQKLISLTDSDSNFLHELLKDDLEKFYSVYPEYRTKWDI